MYTPGSLSKKVEGDEAIISTDDGTQIFTVRAGKGKKTVVLRTATASLWTNGI